MEKDILWAWIIHHTDKLKQFDHGHSYENILDVGKSGKLLSAMSRTDANAVLSSAEVMALAKWIGISWRELDSYLNELKERRLIDIIGDWQVNVNALTSVSVLRHTADIFCEKEVTNLETASIVLSEKVSETPRLVKDIEEEIQDEFHLSKSEFWILIDWCKHYELVDFEDGREGTLLFNGNIYRKWNADKVMYVLETLDTHQRWNVIEVNELLKHKGCVPLAVIEKILGNPLLQKLHSIWYYDVTSVSNAKEEAQFVILPSSLSKYSNAFIEDGLWHAKHLVAALTYWMLYSDTKRWKINSVEKLLRKLIQWKPVGPVRAIEHDYQPLEIAGVVKIYPDEATTPFWRTYTGHSMKLLKKDVGELALEVLSKWEANSEVVLLSTRVSHYYSPEENRMKLRKVQTPEEKKNTEKLLLDLRSCDA